jgi:elongation factor Ts
MADITASMVKELRARTQAGMAACKDALVEAGADMEKAVEIILKKGLVKAADRAGRIAAEGEVATWVSPDAKKGVIVEVNCQTDFVSRGDDFKGFVKNVLLVASTAAKGADLGTLPYPGSDRTVEATRAAIVAKSGENTVIRRWGQLEAKEPTSFIHTYVHNGRVAVLVSIEGPDPKHPELRSFVDNVAMQIAAMSPTVVHKDHVAPADIDRQKDIFGAQMKEEHAAGTLKAPEASWPKIIEGKIAKWFNEITLHGQDNVWDPAAGTVDKVRQELGRKLGGEVKIHGFLRYALGEGIEKKTEDLAAEVAKTIGA